MCELERSFPNFNSEIRERVSAGKITLVDATSAIYTKLFESDVPAINVVFPWTDHAFDVLFPLPR